MILLIIGIDVYSSKFTQKTITNCIPTFPDGDGPYYRPDSPFRDKLAQTHRGEKLVVYGQVLRSDCKTPMKNIILDIWQADETGIYHEDSYRGKVRTDSNGFYVFETVKPKGYGEGTGYRPPHIHFKVWEENRLIITSEMFFPEVKGTTGFEDAFIMKLVSEGKGKDKHLKGYHDIIVPE